MSGEISIQEKHHALLRLCHWLNFIFLSMMIWSGILIYWAHQPYIKVPESIAEFFQIDHRLAEGMGWHFFIMWLFLMNGILYVSWLLFSGEWKNLVPDRHTFRGSYHMFLHELKLRKDPPPMRGKFNPLQGLTYFFVILMGMGSLITGISIYRPVQVGWLTSLLGGYEWARFEHFLLMLGFVLFIIIHIIQVIRAGWNNFRAMVAGYEINKKT